MTRYMLIPFYRTLVTRHRQAEDPTEYETRVAGRVVHGVARNHLECLLVDGAWDLGYPIDAEDLNDLVSKCRWKWTVSLNDHVSGDHLVARNNVPENKDPTRFLFMPRVQPSMASAKFYELGTFNFDGDERVVLTVMTEEGLRLDGTDTLKPAGYYHESVAASNSAYPEFVTFVFQRMRELGFKSTQEENTPAPT